MKNAVRCGNNGKEYNDDEATGMNGVWFIIFLSEFTLTTSVYCLCKPQYLILFMRPWIKVIHVSLALLFTCSPSSQIVGHFFLSIFFICLVLIFRKHINIFIGWEQSRYFSWIFVKSFILYLSTLTMFWLHFFYLTSIHSSLSVFVQNISLLIFDQVVTNKYIIIIISWQLEILWCMISIWNM